MRAAVLNSVPGRLDIEDVEIRDPGPREVLERTVAAGLCHSDLHFMEGLGSNQFRTDMPRFVEMYRSGRLKLDGMISNRITLDDINDGFDGLKQGSIARSVIVF